MPIKCPVCNAWNCENGNYYQCKYYVASGLIESGLPADVVADIVPLITPEWPLIKEDVLEEIKQNPLVPKDVVFKLEHKPSKKKWKLRFNQKNFIS